MKKSEFENAILCIINRFPDASLGDCYKIIEMFERDLNVEILNKKSIDSDDGSYEIIECNNPMIQSNTIYEKLDIIIQLHSPNNSDNEGI